MNAANKKLFNQQQELNKQLQERITQLESFTPTSQVTPTFFTKFTSYISNKIILVKDSIKHYTFNEIYNFFRFIFYTVMIAY